MFYYDTNGVLRGARSRALLSFASLLFDDDGLMWFSASTHHMVAMNHLGKLEKIYDLGSDYILHHDYAMDSNGDIVLLATEIGRGDNAVQDQVIKLSTSTGSVTSLVDFGELFADYKGLHHACGNRRVGFERQESLGLAALQHHPTVG